MSRRQTLKGPFPASVLAFQGRMHSVAVWRLCLAAAQ